MPLDLTDLSQIPTPSPNQVKKDLQRESIRVNGLLCNGSSGFIYHLLVICRLSGIRKTLSGVIDIYVNIDAGMDVHPEETLESNSTIRLDHSVKADHTNTTLIDKIVESICRTRIGEYCYNFLCTCD